MASIGAPHGKLDCLWAEREPRSGAPDQVMQPDIRCRLRITAVHGHSVSIRRNGPPIQEARRPKRAGDLPGPIEPGKLSPTRRASRSIGQDAILRNGENISSRTATEVDLFRD